MRPLQRLGCVALLGAVLLVGCADKDRNRAIAVMNEGIAQYERGNYNGAVARFEEASSLDPDFALPYYYAGMVRLRRFHSPETAIPDLRRAADLMDDHAPTFYQLGSAHLELGDRRDAEEALTHAVELNPEHSRAWYRLGELREANGEIMEAVDAYTRSIHAEPREPYAYKNLGGIYMTYEHPTEAAAVFEEGLRHSGDTTLANDLGTAYLALNRPEEAIAAISQALESEPSSVLYNYNLGLAYAQAFRGSEDPQHSEQAIAYLRQAVDGCGQLDSQARCNQIRMMLTEMENTDEP